MWSCYRKLKVSMATLLPLVKLPKVLGTRGLNIQAMVLIVVVLLLHRTSSIHCW